MFSAHFDLTLIMQENGFEQNIFLTALTRCTLIFRCYYISASSIFSCFKHASRFNCLTHIQIVFPSGTELLHGIMNLHQKAVCVSITDLLFSEYALISNSQCYHVQTITRRPYPSTYPHRIFSTLS